MGPNERWSARRKREVVLRLLRGEPLDTVSRATGVEVYRLEQWREKAMSGLDEALRDRTGCALQTELFKVKRHIGELSKLDEKLDLAVASFCAGTPSTQGTSELLRRMGVTAPQTFVSQRYSGNGWPSKATAVFPAVAGKPVTWDASLEQS